MSGEKRFLTGFSRRPNSPQKKGAVRIFGVYSFGQLSNAYTLPEQGCCQRSTSDSVGCGGFFVCGQAAREIVRATAGRFGRCAGGWKAAGSRQAQGVHWLGVSAKRGAIGSGRFHNGRNTKGDWPIAVRFLLYAIQSLFVKNPAACFHKILWAAGCR